VKKEAAGEYTCQIITEDNIKTKYITLRVDDKPPHADVDTGMLIYSSIKNLIFMHEFNNS